METITRRQACVLLGIAPFVAAGIARGLTADRAYAEEATAAALASAQEQYNSVQAQINELGAQYEALSLELDATLSAMEAKQAEINDTIAQIEATQAELAATQEELAWYVENGYKSGRTNALDVVLGSSSYEELFRNVYYLTKINNSQVELIERTREIKRQLEEQQAALEAQYAELDALRAQQEQQLAEMAAQQDELYILLSNLDAEVQALTEQYNQELIAQAAAAEAERRAAEEAAAQQAAGGGGGGGGGSWVGGVTGSGSASAVVNACYVTPSPGAGYCAAWVTNVFLNAGVGGFYGNACDMYASWCYSTDRGSLQTGMIVAVPTWSGTAAGQIYGHVGIYIGGGMVMDNIGYIRTIDIDSWCGTYSTTVSPRWGWLGGVALS